MRVVFVYAVVGETDTDETEGAPLRIVTELLNFDAPVSVPSHGATWQVITSPLTKFVPARVGLVAPDMLPPFFPH